MVNTGQVLNDTYQITERLGSGAGGIIFKAYHRRMRKYVAIKLIKEEIKGSLDNRSEVDVLKNLKHEYLPQVLDFVEDGNDVYTVMEFIEGQNFKQLITDGRRFDEKSVRKYALQLCEAVEYLHSHQPPIIHSDIKPANIMLTPQGNICLIDFNISIMTNSGAAAAVGGSRGFAAPEQFKQIINAPIEADEFREETRFVDNDETEILFGSEQTNSASVSGMRTKNITRAFIDMRTDIYGIGASLYYILTSRIPSPGRFDFRGIRCSSVIKEVIAKAMNPDPSKRYRNIAELKKALHSRISVRMTAAFVAVIWIASICAKGVVNGSFDRIKENFAAATTVGTSVSGETAETTISPIETTERTLSPREAFKSNKVTAATEPQVEEFITIKGEHYSTLLTELKLGGKDLTDEDIKSLEKMVNLTSLDLRFNLITDISSLSGLTNLTDLDLRFNQISDIIPLSGLTNLTDLDLRSNQISDISALSGLTNLIKLNLGNNQISNISALSKLINLTNLHLDFNQINDISALSGLTNLEFLSLMVNQKISKSDIEALRQALPDCQISN